MIVRRAKKAEAAREQARQALWRSVRVRDRGPGHLRLDLPPQLRSPAAAAALEAGLREVDGVYRVAVYPSLGKLSIRWMEEVCGLADVVRRLAALLDGPLLDGATAALPAVVGRRAGLVERIKRMKPVARLRARFHDLKAKAEIAGRLIALKAGVKEQLPFDAGEMATSFVTDLVAFYLIRLHWARITKEWLPRPWTYRYQWLVVLYLTFLLVRHRKAKKAGADAELPPPCCGGV